jgi:hypothetical protein
MQSELLHETVEKMINRKGEKIGWIGDWLAGFIWLGLISVVWLFQNKLSI